MNQKENITAQGAVLTNCRQAEAFCQEPGDNLIPWIPSQHEKSVVERGLPWSAGCFSGETASALASMSWLLCLSRVQVLKARHN